MLGGQFVPEQGSGCDTGLRFENGSQTGGLSSAGILVKRITGKPLTGGKAEGSFFVKIFAKPEKAREMAISSGQGREFRVGNTGWGESLEPGSSLGFSLARMLLPDVCAMIADFFSTTTDGRYLAAAPQKPADTPRGLYVVPSFFCHCLLRESFHKSVGTQSRPLRGGKEGSVCRVM
jgi:hypothetical protein